MSRLTRTFSRQVGTGWRGKCDQLKEVTKPSWFDFLRFDSRPRKNSRGFTLLEVMAAFAITVFTLTAVFEIWTGAISRTVITDRRQQALELARSLMAEQRAARRADAATITGTDAPFQWTVTRQDFPPPSGATTGEWKPVEIQVEITWPTLTGEEGVSLTSIVLAKVS